MIERQRNNRVLEFVVRYIVGYMEKSQGRKEVKKGSLRLELANHQSAMMRSDGQFPLGHVR